MGAIGADALFDLHGELARGNQDEHAEPGDGHPAVGRR